MTSKIPSVKHRPWFPWKGKFEHGFSDRFKHEVIEVKKIGSDDVTFCHPLEVPNDDGGKLKLLWRPALKGEER